MRQHLKAEGFQHKSFAELPGNENREEQTTAHQPAAKRPVAKAERPVAEKTKAKKAKRVKRIHACTS
jgi:hypothetical protein